MKPDIKTYILNDDNEKFFGDGPYFLLLGIESHGSLKAAAASMGMAYSKAVKILHTAEQSLGYELTTKTIGGKKGGGSTITEKGKEFIVKYEQYKKRSKEASRQIFEEIFSEQ